MRTVRQDAATVELCLRPQMKERVAQLHSQTRTLYMDWSRGLLLDSGKVAKIM